MSTAQRPSLWRVLSDTSRIISSNALHFTVLSVLFIFPMLLINVIHSLLLPRAPPHHYGRLLAAAAVANHSSVSKFPSMDVKSQILHALITLIFNLCATSSVTTSFYDGLRSKPLKLGASLKSILSSFLPLLATKLVYSLILVAVTIAFGFVLFFGLALIGIDVMSIKFLLSDAPIVATILLIALFLYVDVQLCLAYAVVVVESKYGYAPLKRSWSLVKGVRLVAFLLVAMLTIVQTGLVGWLWAAASTDGGCSAGVVAQMVLYAALSTVVGLFALGATTVLLVRCKEFHGESEESMEFQSDGNKLAKLYVPLPHDVVDQV